MTRTTLGRGLVLAASLLIVACNANSAPSVLTDPKEILKAAAANAATATSFHLDLTADGTLNLDLTGTGVGSTPIKLTGTTAAGDIDVAGKATKLTFAIPGLLGLAGEVIVKDGTAYYKTTLTGALYKKQSAANAPTPSVDPSAVPKMLATLDEFLAKPGVDPAKGADVDCGGKTCSTVTIQLTPAELAALNGGSANVPVPSALPIPVPLNLTGASVDLSFRVERDTNRLAGAAATLGFADGGKLTTDITFSNWNAPVAISAPAADQVAP